MAPLWLGNSCTLCNSDLSTTYCYLYCKFLATRRAIAQATRDRGLLEQRLEFDTETFGWNLWWEMNHNSRRNDRRPQGGNYKIFGVEDGIRFFRHIDTICQSVRRHIPLDILPLSLVSWCIWWHSLNCARCICTEQCLM